MKISVVMPVYNECWTIREIVRRVLVAPEAVAELVIVDDGSTDGTRELIRGLEKKHAGGKTAFKVIFRQTNGGKGAALVDGFQAATGDIVIIQDADLEYDPQDYPQLVAPIREGRADAVYGSRFLGGRHNVLFFWHSIANWLLTLSCNVVSNLNLTDVWTGYKAFRAGLIKRIPLSSRGFDFEPEITIKLAKLHCRLYEVPVSYQGRGYAEGKKIGLKDAFIGTWATIKTALWGDLGDLARGEQRQSLLAKADNSNRLVYERFRGLLGQDVVELGAGAGGFSRFLLDRRRLLLTESDPSSLQVLRATYEGWDYVEVRELEPASGRLPDGLAGAFDTAVCFGALGRADADAAALATAARLLKPGGTLLLRATAERAEGLEPRLKEAGLEPLEVLDLGAARFSAARKRA